MPAVEPTSVIEAAPLVNEDRPALEPPKVSVPCRTESVTVAVDQRNRAVAVRGDEVDLLVAIKIADRNRIRVCADRDVDTAAERPVVVAEQHGDVVRAAVDDGEIVAGIGDVEPCVDSRD